MSALRFTINGPTAKQNAKQLVDQIPEAEIKTNDKVFRGDMFIAIIEIAKSAGDIAGSVGGAISMAQLVWTWHKSRRNNIDSVSISKSEEEGKPTESIILDDKVTEEDVFAFFQTKS